MRWFRRKKEQKEEQAPVEAAAPEPVEPQAEAAEGAEAPADAAAAKRKRRRGTRGGRARKKTPAEAAPAEQPDESARPARKPARRDRPAPRRRVAARRAALPAAKRELLVSADVGEQRVAVLEDGKVAEVYLERPERRSIAGNVYLGLVDNVLPGMEAAFVEIGLEKNGFLYVDEIVVPELEGKRHGKRIQDLLSRGQTLLVQAVKDPMKTKGARLTTEISLPGRFVVFVPNGEGLGVSRRLPDEERTRLKDVVKALDVKQGGVIVRTAAEGASAEDIERDLVFLQRLWKTIEERAKQVSAPSLIYQEAELPLRVIRDLFTGDFERAYIDHERTYKRIVGYLKKTSPHMVERVERYKDKPPLMEAYGVDAELRSTLSRRVDLPSGGYLVFDYAEAFTVIDVNTGRFVGGRGKTSTGRLEDTITKNNLEAVKEVVRQLRMRDIGGIIVIDFIDMANPKNRATVEEALRTELERDRTKTYVVEISPLGLVEMTRQNVTDGPREILTKKCPTCLGDGIVVSEASAAVELERRLRALAAGSRVQAFRVELNPRVASVLVGPAASRLKQIEEVTRRRFFIQPTGDGHGLDHFAVVAQGKLEELRPEAPVDEGQELELKLVEVGLHDAGSAVGKLDGYDVCVADSAKLVGRKVKVRIERVLDGTAYAARVDADTGDPGVITAEAVAERPTRAPRARKPKAAAEPAVVEEEPVVGEAEPAGEDAEPEAAGEAPARKRTRRGSRGGRGRKRKTPVAGEAGETEEAAEAAEPVEAVEPVEEAPAEEAELPVAPRIHLPDEELGREEEDDEEEAASEGETKLKRTRRGSRGGRRRKKKAPLELAAAEGTSSDGAEPAEATPEEAAEWEYVPMSEWEDELTA